MEVSDSLLQISSWQTQYAVKIHVGRSRFWI